MDFRCIIHLKKHAAKVRADLCTDAGEVERRDEERGGEVGSSPDHSSSSQCSTDDTYTPSTSSDTVDSYEISTPPPSPSTSDGVPVIPNSVLSAVLSHSQGPRPPNHTTAASNTPTHQPPSHCRRYIPTEVYC